MNKRTGWRTEQTVKQFCRVLTAAMLILLLFILSIPSVIALENETNILPDSDIPETLTREQLASHGAVARLREEEPDEFTFVYLNDDGTRTSYSYGVPVKYEENGEIIDKNNAIKDFNGKYGNTASDMELRFPKKLGKISVKYKNHNIKIEPITSANKADASINGNAVTYYGAFGLGTDLKYSSTMSGMKEDIILQSYQGVNSFSFEIKTNGLELKQLNGQYVIADGETTVFSFGDLEVTDSFTGIDEATDNWAEHITYAQGSIQTIKENDKYIFTVTVSADFLTSPATVYPVYIDPSFNVDRQYIQDTYIAAGYTNNYVNASLVAVGYGTNSKNIRTVAKITSLYGGNTVQGKITSAYYSMYCTSNYSSSPTVDVYTINPDITWNPSTATWQNSANLIMNNSTKISSLTVGGAGRYNFNITAAYQSWQLGTVNNGLMFRMTTEVSGKYRQFSSANVSTSTNLAYITVTYDLSVIGIQLSQSSAYMSAGETLQLAWMVYPTELSGLTWESSNPSVATVNQTGLITAISTGSATITARSVYSESSYATCQIEVVAQRVTGVSLNYDSAYIAKGKTLSAMAVVLPSNATIQSVTWQSNNTSVATVSQYGTITAVAPGTATITVRTVEGNKTDTMTVIVPEFEDGEYYLQNKSTKRYADIEGPTNDSGAIIHQWDYHGYASQQWEFTLLTDGYYKIKSMHSNLYLSVQNNSSQQDAPVIQAAYTGGTGQKWKVELLANGHYKITPKCGESVNRVLACAAYSENANGIDIQQRLYVDDTNYKDEWVIFSFIENFTIKMYYDRAFSIRYADGTDNAAKTILEGFENRVAEVFREEFHVNITFLEPEYYASLPDRCVLNQGLTLNATTINHECPATPHLNGECSIRPEGSYCTERLQIYRDFISAHPGGNGAINILYTGHSLYDNNGTVINRSFSWYDGGICIQRLVNTNVSYIDQVMGTVIHEISHKFGAPDHYCDDHDKDPNTLCLHHDICSKDGVNPRPSECIMCTVWDNLYVNSGDTENIYCSACKADMMEYLTGGSA